MSLLSKIYEHLITKGKYNTLKVNYNVIKKEYDDKIIENDQLRNQYKVIKGVWENTLKKQEEEIVELKKKIKESKKNKKEIKNES